MHVLQETSSALIQQRSQGIKYEFKVKYWPWIPCHPQLGLAGSTHNIYFIVTKVSLGLVIMCRAPHMKMKNKKLRFYRLTSHSINTPCCICAYSVAAPSSLRSI